jgi:hypothetical protein
MLKSFGINNMERRGYTVPSMAQEQVLFIGVRNVMLGFRLNVLEIKTVT